MPAAAKYSTVSTNESEFLKLALEREQLWLKHVLVTMEQEEVTKDEKVSWSAFHAINDAHVPANPGISSLLPLLKDCAHTPATIRHCMDIIKRAVQYLNPTQTPVITVDQPLFAIAKKIQWTWKNYDEHITHRLTGVF